jgi:hypothetical protein
MNVTPITKVWEQMHLAWQRKDGSGGDDTGHRESFKKE